MPPVTNLGSCLHKQAQHSSSKCLTLLFVFRLSQIADKIGLPGLYLHEAVEDESTEGTGNLIWPAGIRLSQHLVKNRGGELRGARVLDLGSGTGTGETAQFRPHSLVPA